MLLLQVFIIISNILPPLETNNTKIAYPPYLQKRRVNNQEVQSENENTFSLNY